MKMKNLLIGGMSLALVACISVGGTLAYLTSKTETMTNTFKFGNFTITQKEDVEGASGVQGHTYQNVVPGDVLKKDVKISLTSDTATNAYVYVAVKDGAANVNYGTKEGKEFINGVTDEWEKVAGPTAYDLYVYVGEDGNEAVPVNNLGEVSLFTHVQVPYTEEPQSFNGDQTIQIASYAIQADHVTDYQTKAIAHFDKLFNS